MTLSPGPMGSSVRNSAASASTKAAALRCVTATPLGLPVEPEVKMIHASCSTPGRAAGASLCPSTVSACSAPMTARTSASPNTSSARSSGSSASTGT